ncbi:hypothetical protein PSAC2689_50004 [Paraburkholderia sacchari]
MQQAARPMHRACAGVARHRPGTDAQASFLPQACIRERPLRRQRPPGRFRWVCMKLSLAWMGGEVRPAVVFAPGNFLGEPIREPNDTFQTGLNASGKPEPRTGQEPGEQAHTAKVSVSGSPSW